MDLLALHMYHLDDDDEADQIIQLLKRNGLESQWRIERPNENTNAIFIPVLLDDGALTETWQIRQAKFNKALGLLLALNQETINAIKNLGLRVALRIHTDEFYLPIPSDLVTACGNLGLEICILSKVVSK
jgi:hypothetical protein